MIIKNNVQISICGKERDWMLKKKKKRKEKRSKGWTEKKRMEKETKKSEEDVIYMYDISFTILTNTQFFFYLSDCV